MSKQVHHEFTIRDSDGNMVTVEIRNERPNDYAATRDVNIRAFGDDEVANLIEVMRARKRVSSALVAVAENRIVGHIVFSDITVTDSPAAFRGVGLAPLAVLPEFQNRGVGSQLTKVGIEACRQAGYGVMVVLGHPTYYPRFGFSKAKDHGLDNEYNAQDAFMVMELESGALRGIKGLVKYVPEFREAGL